MLPAQVYYHVKDMVKFYKPELVALDPLHMW
jgi:hypothetical protein